jgi:hypothetical protein
LRESLKREGQIARRLKTSLRLFLEAALNDPLQARRHILIQL